VKTALFVVFSIHSFLISFILAAGAFFLRLWVDFSISAPARLSMDAAVLFQSFHWALPFALYVGVLLTVNYGFRRKINLFLIFIITVSLFSVFAFLSSAFNNNLNSYTASPIELKGETLGEKGLILRVSDAAIVLLDEPGNETGSRAVYLPDSGIVYQAVPRGADGEFISLPKIPFFSPKNSVFDELRIDFALSAKQIFSRYQEGFKPFAAWVFSLILLQTSLSLIFNIGVWPLASLFFGAAILRLVLALEVFLNSEEIQSVLLNFLGGIIPSYYISPAVFAALSVLMLLYVVLAAMARGGSKIG
jgi:hypothetical protein